MISDFIEILIELAIGVLLVIIFMLPYVISLVIVGAIARWLGMNGLVWLGFVILVSITIGSYVNVKLYKI